MDIYIKPKKKAALVGVQRVTVGHVADVFADGGLKKRAEAVGLASPKTGGAYLISVIDIVAAISAALPGHAVVNLGEMDTIVSLRAAPPKKNRAWQWTKIAAVSLILFTGSITAIMTFHTDSQLSTVFSKYHEMFFGTAAQQPHIITIPYAIGLAVGIVVFFNHFGGRRLTKEPTPIEVELATYEKDVEDALIAQIELDAEKDK